MLTYWFKLIVYCVTIHCFLYFVSGRPIQQSIPKDLYEITSRQFGDVTWWNIKLYVKLPTRTQRVRRKSPSTWFINKGKCPRSLCPYDKVKKKRLPRFGRKEFQTPFYQGDIVLDSPYEHLYSVNYSRRKLRNKLIDRLRKYPNIRPRFKRATSLESRLWKDARVPYVFDKDFVEANKKYVQEAHAHIENYTCIRFVEKTADDTDFINYVNEAGCWSFIGKTGDEQKVSLGEGCEDTGTAVHETIHALGFWHEQGRHDRDEYVEVVEDNIISYYLSDFSIIPETVAPDRGFAYDYESIMHYKSHTYTRNAENTINVIGPGKDLDLVIGQRDRLSNLDIAQLNSMYGCTQKEDSEEVECPVGWVKHELSCYKFFSEPLSQFGQAWKQCAKWNANLVAVDSSAEDTFIKEHLKKEYTSDRSLQWRTAGKKYNNEFSWYNSFDKTNTPMTYTNWASGHPATYSTLVYVCTNPDKGNYEWKGAWAGSSSGYPDSAYAYICETTAKRKCVDLKETDGSDYRGNLSHTQGYITCQTWSSKWPQSHTLDLSQDGLGDHNYCRNPKQLSREKPWCFTTQLKKEWDYCDIKACSDCDTSDVGIIDISCILNAEAQQNSATQQQTG